MNLSSLWLRAQGQYQRSISKWSYRRTVRILPSMPHISFSFDDFPASAYHVGGAILSRYGFRGTYYVSFGLLGADTPSGRICVLEDVENLLADGHELGCHTYAHCHSWNTIPDMFEQSLLENKQALTRHMPAMSFESLAYPIVGPRPETKRRAGGHFRSCRGGGQIYNSGVVDLNLLKAYFLEKSRDNLDAVKRMVDQCIERRGWLIFATHDISDTPTPYGCSPAFFEEIVRYSVESGAAVLPVTRALNAIVCDDTETKLD